MVDLVMWLDDDDLRHRYGSATLERARDYVRRGKVVAFSQDIDDDGDLDIRGHVTGSTGELYLVYLSVGPGGDGAWVSSRCSCPVAEGCKHAAALLLTAREAQELDAGLGIGGDRRWERQLDSMLDELDGAAGNGASAAKPLGLQVDLQPPSRGGYAAWGAPAPPWRGTLRIRPVQRGARDNWVRSGISWRDVPHLDVRRAFDPRQVAVLAELLAAYHAASRQMYPGSPSHLTLDTFGSSLWSLLHRTAESGMTLVLGTGLDDLAVARDPVVLQLDVNSAAARDAHIRLGARVGDQWYAADEIDVIGQTGHGVALWQPGNRSHAWALTLAPLARPVGPAVRRLLASGDSLVVPPADRDALVKEYLPRLQRHVSVVSSDGSVVVAEPPTPRLALTVTWVAADEVTIGLSWRYLVGSDDRVYGLTETRGLRDFRRPDLERQVLDALDLDDEQVRMLCDGHRRESGLVEQRAFTHGAAVGFAEDVLPRLEASGDVEITEIGQRPDYREAEGAPVIHFTSRADAEGGADEARTDWLDLEVVISVDGQYVALTHLLEALTRGQNRIVMPNGLHLGLDRPEFSQLAELVAAAGELQEQPRDGVRVGHHDLGLWDELAEVGIIDAQASQWVRAAQALRSLVSLPDVEPTGLKAELRPYQLDGFRWLAFLWQSRLGGILADDMGLGKTLQTLALVAHARERGAKPFLVVAPTSVVSMWAHEAEQFAPGLAVRTVTESRARRGTSIAEVAEGTDLLVTSYTLYRLEVDDYLGEDWGGLVLDEAQTVKNHQGKTHQCVRRLDVPFRLVLTGTPMENRLLELWSLLSIVAPGLYPYAQRFVELVANPVERLGDTAALDRFRRRIRPFLLRRTKEIVASDLPPKQEQVLDVQLTPRHRRVYETHLQRERQAVLGLVEDFDRNRVAIFRSLTKLRQLSLDAALVDAAYDGIGSAKIDVLVDHVRELASEGHRALVFSQFTSFLSRVRDRLEGERIKTAYLDGKTRRRGQVVDDFKAGDAPVFLISLKAGGVGLTLTEADYVFVLDPWWNPAVEAQAVDRTHRIGQQQHVMVYRLVATDTIEEKVMELKARKAALFARVIDGDGAMASAIGADDVRALFDD